jgi:nucleoside-diphosphate-sugar epimerase
VARCLIVGCGCRGRQLAAALVQDGHAVRGTTRRGDEMYAIEAAGAEPVLADPDRVVSLMPWLDHVSVVVLLLGTASGPPESVAALHSSRLEMLLLKVLDTTVRGLVYEAAGTVDADVLAGGAELVRSTCEGSRIPFSLLDAAPGSSEWLTAARDAVASVLS